MVAFRCYDPSVDGRGGIHSWYVALSPIAKGQVDSAVELLELEDDFDGIDEVEKLRGACEGLTEIKIDFHHQDAEVHIRILGFDGPGKNEFTLLTGFQKENDNSIYGIECKKAHERKSRVLRDGNRAPPCGFP